VLHAGFLLDLFFDPEDGDDMLLRNICRFSTVYTVISQKTELLYIITSNNITNDDGK
jgi:hypothetical protein